MRTEPCCRNCLHFVGGRCGTEDRHLSEVLLEGNCPYFEERLADMAEISELR